MPTLKKPQKIDKSEKITNSNMWFFKPLRIAHGNKIIDNIAPLRNNINSYRFASSVSLVSLHTTIQRLNQSSQNRHKQTYKSRTRHSRRRHNRIAKVQNDYHTLKNLIH